MMPDDPIIAEIRRIRAEYAAQFHGDLHAMCEDLRRRERESGRKYVTLPPRRIEPEHVSDAATKPAEV
jgi:hypothetical protein